MWPHRRRPTPSILASALLLLLAGCSQGPAEAPEAPASGSIEGVVTDAALRPVADAVVRVGSLGNVTTDASGVYRLGAAWPDGSVVVTVHAPGFEPASKAVRPATAAHALQLNFTLQQLPRGPWTDTHTYNGFIACGLIAQVGHTHGGSPEDDNHLACPILTPEGKQRIDYIPERDPDDMVIEVFWQAGSDLAEYITVILYDDQGELVQFEEGDSPLRMEVGKAHVKQRFQDGRGGTIELRAGISEEDPPGELYYSVFVDQRFDVFATTSHGAALPIGWSVTG